MAKRNQNTVSGKQCTDKSSITALAGSVCVCVCVCVCKVTSIPIPPNYYYKLAPPSRHVTRGPRQIWVSGTGISFLLTCRASLHSTSTRSQLVTSMDTREVIASNAFAQLESKLMAPPKKSRRSRRLSSSELSPAFETAIFVKSVNGTC